MKTKKPSRPRWLSRLVGPLSFAPAQHADFINLLLVDSLAELRGIVSEWGDSYPDDDMDACCCFDHDGDNYYHGFVIFAREKLTRPLVVHELVHAGMIFVGADIMASEEVMKMSDDERGEYYDEACARIVEHLYEQAERLLWPNTPVSNGPESGPPRQQNDRTP